MWTAAKRKKEARRRHASNINAGYVEVDEYHLYRTGIRGRKSLVVWCVLVSLIIIALANLAVSKIYKLCNYAQIVFKSVIRFGFHKYQI